MAQNPTAVAVELEPHYYRDNFLRLCDTVERQYGDLLEPDEQGLLRDFRALDHAAQCLYVRLVSRVGPHFRLRKLEYPELGDLAPPVRQLEAAGLLDADCAPDVAELGRLFTVAELRRALGEFLLQTGRSGGKAALLAAIEAAELPPDECLARLGVGSGERIIAPLQTDIVALLQLLFFGNRRQGLTDFILSDLGVARYYDYPLDRSQRLFTDRAAVDEYLECSLLRDRFLELREAADWPGLTSLGGELLSLRIHRDSTRIRWQRLCNGVARELERRDEPDLALALYRVSARHPARERSARILELQENPEGALALCREIQADPWCEAELDAARRMLPRLRRKLEGGRHNRPRETFASVSLRLPRADEPVELLAAEALRGKWQAVHYVENGLMNSLFGLAFWEQIFAPVPGAFHNPYQSAPSDMYEPDFRTRRQGSLARRLAQLAEADLRRELPAAWRRYQPCQCRWVNWRLLDEALLDRVLACVPRAHLVAIWERILFDPGENRRGFPDLIALGDGPGNYRMIEVKSPGDQLQDSQKRWLRYFDSRDIPAQVLRVEWDSD